MARRPVVRFVLHYLEMVAAMGIGMMLLYPVWLLATYDVAPSSPLRSTEVEVLVMATTMTVPMAVWMRFRGHRWPPVLEMGAAMYAGFVVLFPALWAGLIDGMDVMMWGHVLMFGLMVAAMLWRREEYAHGCHRRTRATSARRTIDATA